MTQLYHISNIRRLEDQFSAGIRFDATHPVFEGHFPGQPIVPGVCLVAIVKEVVEQVLETNVELQHGHSIKFLKVIDPREHAEVEISARGKHSDEGAFIVNAGISAGESVFFKFRGTFL